MSSVEVRVNTDNAAFEGLNRAVELAGIYGSVIGRIAAKDYLNNKWHDVRDSNGNIVGQFRVVDD